MASQSVEEYMEAIYRLGGDSGTVSTCELADLLGVAPPSVTTMLGRLSRDGLVKHVRYKGITLTPHGREMAAAMIRRHRLSERLLTDVLGMPWDRVHEAACKLEHVMTGEIEDRTFSVLGEPERCPHGHLLEGKEDGFLVLLSDIIPGECAVVVKIDKESPEFLKFAAESGLTPSAKVVVESACDEQMQVTVSGQSNEICKESAALIWVRRLDNLTAEPV